jgi:hypothetical protein
MDRLQAHKQIVLDHNKRFNTSTTNSQKNIDSSVGPVGSVGMNDTYTSMFNESLQACYVLLNDVTRTPVKGVTFKFPSSGWYYDRSISEDFKRVFTYTLQQFGITVVNFYDDEGDNVYSDLTWSFGVASQK